MDFGRYGYKFRNRELFEPVSIRGNHLLLVDNGDEIRKACTHFRRENKDPTTSS